MLYFEGSQTMQHKNAFLLDELDYLFGQVAMTESKNHPNQGTAMTVSGTDECEEHAGHGRQQADEGPAVNGG